MNSLLFGNIIEDGDNEMGELLQNASTMLGGMGSLMGFTDEDLAPPKQEPDRQQQHASDAVDYADIEEEDLEEQLETIQPQNQEAPQQTSPQQARLHEQEESKYAKLERAIASGKPLKFTELFSSGNDQKQDVCGPFAVRIVKPPYVPIREESDVKLFNSYQPLPKSRKITTGYVYKPLKMSVNSKQLEKASNAASLDRHVADVDPYAHHPVNTFDWESQIIYSDKDDLTDNLLLKQSFSISNYDLEAGEWESLIIWDDEDAERLKNCPVQINLNDVSLSVEILKQSNERNGGVQNFLNQQTAQYTQRQGALMDRLNISNDAYYQTARKSGRVRQQFGRIFIQHSLPALKLQLPFFKRMMTKHELRAWHRPQLKMNPGDTMQFFKVKSLKKMRVRGRDVTDVLTHARDISLKDNSDFLLFEYAEEYPPLLSNPGMGSFIMNYYRKKDEKDQFTPKLFDGMPGILEQVDASPFFCFGNVEVGETVQAIKNNLYVAPIYKQELHNDDYLLIRTTLKGQSRCYLRAIPRVYAVGQIFPLTEVPPPQSRKMKTFIRDRLRVVAFRRIRKRGRQTRYGVSRIVNTFHRYNEQSLRKHLKDEFNIEKSKKTGNLLISVKEKTHIPSEQELFRLVSPEQVCIFESMRVGLQRLADCGYGTGEIAEEDDLEEGAGESQLDDEVKMAPWNIVKNVLLAAQSKGMIQVHGSGDPTGCGLGYSFFWYSMKEMFLWAGATKLDYENYYISQAKTGHKFSLHDQQRFYKQEMKKVWDSQARSLSSTADIESNQDDEAMSSAAVAVEADQENEAAEAEMKEMMQLIEHSKGLKKQDSKVSQDEDAKSISSRTIAMAPKGYLIRRSVKDALSGKEVWEEEVLTDPRVINAYLKQKQLAQLTGADQWHTMDIDDDEARKKRITAEIAKLKKEHGFTQVQLQEGPVTGVEKDGTKRLGGSHRKCTSCKQIGHIMTNRICPNFATNFPDRVKKPKPVVEGPIKSKDGKIILSANLLKDRSDQRKSQSSLTNLAESVKAESSSNISSKQTSPEKQN